VLDKMRPWRNW